MRGRLRSDESLHQAIMEIDPLSRIDTGGVSDAVSRFAEELQHAEVYDTAPDLNALQLPIDCGDIFRSDTGDQFVVIAQVCDLVVRGDGRRKDDNREERQVVALAKLNSRQRSSRNRRLPENEFELGHFTDDSKMLWVTEVNQIFFVPVWLLDMAVFNRDGECAVSPTDPPSGLLTQPWRKRLEILQHRARDAVALADAAAMSAGEQRNELLRSLLRLPLSTTFTVTLDPPERQVGEPWTLRIGLRRTLRLRERYASALLAHYANYLSRPGQPHDLTKTV